MNGKLIVLSAPSGSGKTTIVKNLLKKSNLKLKFSISATSRKKRSKEIHGKDYYFFSIEDFKKEIKQNAFIEWEEVYNNQFYGTLKSEIERIIGEGYNVIFDIDVRGGLNIKKMYKEECLTIFIMPPSLEELEYRLRKRGTDSEESLNKRLSKARKEINFSKDFDKLIINDDLNIALIEASKIIINFINKA